MQRNIEQWLNKSGVTSKVIADFGLSYTNHAFYGEVLVIPVYDINGNFLFNKYRRSPTRSDTDGPKYTYDKGGKVSLWGSANAKNEQRVVICEGERDALVLWSLNIPAVTSTGGAQSFQSSWVPYFDKKEVYICYDNDTAGAEGAARTLALLPHAKIVLVPEIAGIKDVSDYVSHGGDMHELMRTARTFTTAASVEEDRARCLSLFQPTRFHDAYLKQRDLLTKAALKDEWAEKLSDEQRANIADKVLRARAYPIPRLIKFTKNKAVCLYHSEKTPSLNYYTRTNTTFCFGCSKHADSIDIYRQINKCSFQEAIDALQ